LKKFYLFVLSLFVCSSVIPQEAEKTYFENNPKLGGDVVLKTLSFKVVGEDIFKTFEIESLEDGAYYVDAWIMVPLIDGRCPEFKVAVKCFE